jgi:hypothetical protein
MAKKPRGFGMERKAGEKIMTAQEQKDFDALWSFTVNGNDGCLFTCGMTRRIAESFYALGKINGSAEALAPLQTKCIRCDRDD